MTWRKKYHPRSFKSADWRCFRDWRLCDQPVRK